MNRSRKIDWNKVAKQYDTYTVGGFNPAYFELMDYAKKAFQKLKSGSLVGDIGGGTGNFSIMLAEKYSDSQFVVLDNSTEMMDIGREKAKIKNLDNVDFIEGDVENIEVVTRKYQRPMNYALMVHSLYTTGSLNNAKPKRILKNINMEMENDESRFLLIDLNRRFHTNDWIIYSIKNAYKMFRKQGQNIFRSLYRTVELFLENDQAKWVNRELDRKQKSGEYLMCELDQLINLVKQAGFSKIYESNDTMYRGRNNIILAGK